MISALVMLLVFEIVAVVLWVTGQKKYYNKIVANLKETSKMLKKILLRNSCESVDDLIGVLKRDSVSIDFKLA